MDSFGPLPRRPRPRLRRHRLLLTAALLTATATAAVLPPAQPAGSGDPPPPTMAAPPPAQASTLPGSPPPRNAESSGSYWRWERDQRPVTWGVDVFYAGMSPSSQISAFSEAFRRWEAISGIRFRRVAACGWFPFNDPRCVRPAIRISFQPANHGAGWDSGFTGVEGGHAFYPCPTERRLTGCGDVHLANYRRWSWSSLVASATHEVGHAIGIPHAPSSVCPGSLMCPAGGPGSFWEVAQARSRYGP